jgi:hypothetical protein
LVVGPGDIRGYSRSPTEIQLPARVRARAEAVYGPVDAWKGRYLVARCRWSNAASYLSPLAFLTIKYVGEPPPGSFMVSAVGVTGRA